MKQLSEKQLGEVTDPREQKRIARQIQKQIDKQRLKGKLWSKGAADGNREQTRQHNRVQRLRGKAFKAAVGFKRGIGRNPLLSSTGEVANVELSIGYRAFHAGLLARQARRLGCIIGQAMAKSQFWKFNRKPGKGYKRSAKKS